MAAAGAVGRPKFARMAHRPFEEASAPIWQQTPVPAGVPAPTGTVETDVLVIGAGMTGISTALRLQQMGRKVLLVDRHGPVRGETGKTTAHCTSFLDVRYAELVRSYGEDSARRVLELTRTALHTIEALAQRHAPNSFGHVPGFLLTEDASEVGALRTELSTLQSLGAEDLVWEEQQLPWAQARAGMRWARQGWLEPRAYLAGLLGAFLEEGGRFYEGVQVMAVHDGDPCRVEAGELELLAARVVIATHDAPYLLKFIPKLPAYRTYAVALRAESGFPRALAYDTDEPYHYVRCHPAPEGLVAIIGGADHKVGHDDDPVAHWDRLEDWARARLPVGDLLNRWSGQILEPLDGLPLIGAVDGGGRISIATGFSGSGMIWGTVASKLLATQVVEGDHPESALLSPRRLDPMRQWKRFLSENLDFPRQMLRDRVHRPPRPDGPIAVGQGRVLRIANRDVAVARDSGGKLHAVSAICTHMGCRVAFNDAEQSWDCPCHGSRFDLDGAVLNGPATRALPAVDVGTGAREVERPTDAPSRKEGHPDPRT